jgi:DedD protein
MDPALKQRLLGAAVLIVLAIIFVPMLLDGPQTPGTAQTVDLSIPDAPSRDFETQVVPLTPPGQLPTAPTPDPDRIATVDTQAPDRGDALTGADAPEVLPTPTPTTPVETAPVAPAPVAPTPTTSPTPTPTAPAVATDPRGRFAVNFGSYGNAANVQTLITDLRKLGVTATAESLAADGKTVQRVRAGPYVDRTQAERVRLLVKQARADIPAAIVQIDDTPTQDVPASATGTTATGWAVQIGAYQAQADATQQRDKLRAAGFTAFIDTVRAEKGTLYRVRVGPETQRANAERLRDALKARLQLTGLVVPHP